MSTSTFQSGRKISVRAHIGDWKTLLAFNLVDDALRKNLAGFTVHCKTPTGDAFYLNNSLEFEEPSRHAQDPSEPANSAINAPLHMFRWVHTPGDVRENVVPVAGTYSYTVTPRYFDDQQRLLALDAADSVTLDVPVGPLQLGDLELGFTRGATQSQAFVHHFGASALMRPTGDELLFDTSKVSGQNASGKAYTYADQYAWLGFTARARVHAMLKMALDNPATRLDVFAYDLNEPDVLAGFLELARQGRIRLMLDDAALHHTREESTCEDKFAKLFEEAAKKAPAGSPGAQIQRGKFSRYAHDKIFILYDDKGPIRVLTGSTNFSITGLYVNSNHVLVFSDPAVCREYASMFDLVWKEDASKSGFVGSDFSKTKFAFGSDRLPKTEVTFSPHPQEVADKFLQEIATRIGEERDRKTDDGSVLFAVMEMGSGSSPVFTTLNAIHESQTVFSYGVSDSSDGTSLYKPGSRVGVLVSGKPGRTELPPPFDQVRSLGLGHQIHHKFIVCGFTRDDAVVYCGSSNLASGGEAANGDNLLTIHDRRIATAFAIEAVSLVDHFNFMDRVARKAPAAAHSGTASPNGAAATAAHAAADKASVAPAASINHAQAAKLVGWHLGTTDAWSSKYFDPNDLRSADRKLFG